MSNAVDQDFERARKVLGQTGGYTHEMLVRAAELYGNERRASQSIACDASDLAMAADRVREAKRKYDEAKAAYQAANEACDDAHNALHAAGSELAKANGELAEVAAR